MYDIIFSGGTVIDGSGAPRAAADIAVTGDRLVAIGRSRAPQSRQTIDCRGRVIAPGSSSTFTPTVTAGCSCIHIRRGKRARAHHRSADGRWHQLRRPSKNINWRQWLHYLRSLNGLSLADYRGWRSLADYMALLDGRNVQNAATHVPYGQRKNAACGFAGSWPPDDVQMREIKARIRAGMEQGRRSAFRPAWITSVSATRRPMSS